jgi:hypothetical protein
MVDGGLVILIFGMHSDSSRGMKDKILVFPLKPNPRVTVHVILVLYL